jgi:PfaD family protein
VSIAEHLEPLSVYDAMAIRIVPNDGEPEDMLGEGGGLEAAFEHLGQHALLAVLRDPGVASIMLADGDLRIEAHRQQGGGVLRILWSDRVVVEQAVEIPLPSPVHAGPWFRPDVTTEVTDVAGALRETGRPLFAVADVGEQVRWYAEGLHGRGAGAVQLVGTVPAISPRTLGSSAFRAAHGVKWAYVAGAMAGGIASVELVIAMARAGLLGFFGAGGVPLDGVEAALKRISTEVGDAGSWGFNLLHNLAEPAVEERTVDLYLQYGVRRVSASAYMGLTPAIVRYRLDGIHAGPDGEPVVPNHVFAKVSRPEVAEHFLRPAPDAMLERLAADGLLTAEQVALARRVPIAEDITAEADSGGHTDHRPLAVLLPILQRLRDRLSAEHGFDALGRRPRVGAAGGLGEPGAVWMAFALGADYVLTGSVNQAAVEAGTSDLVKEMLATAAYTDIATGPAPDMFEAGAKVQVLSRGSMYAQRATKLLDAYKTYGDLDAIPDRERAKLEKQIFRRPLSEVWEGTRDYWQSRDPRQVEKAERDPRHKLALTFRWYLGMTSRWARIGDDSRKRDFQIWCGPAMGGFNAWVRGTPLEALENRTVEAIATALMGGAAGHARVSSARALGLPLPTGT